ncbi:UDP-N-acetylmuramoyl-L-alanine--D-glutamate ligase [Macrococcus equipercicus]|uniref:UDP-N-acetylmuramoylalanine--D-glutamate ligase n=1 Tax=Macrococcus equipercicus TaxID=69967 RepID=A0A9Q9F2N2_9STAP|nr:UDP-N-acetylmuramoyl-L-alanine--D-glutamate ligase [Macrococcus equipercicus]UTH14576.1 UDP-N-acetylmuramoyl-L-alanine--D-glutamate ligase [Macrococcus equipercicus]
MKNITDYREKHVLVLGLAKSGYETAKLLHRLGAVVTVNDGKDLTDNQDARELKEMGVTVIDKEHPLTLLDTHELIVKNPGIPYHVPLLKEAVSRNIPVITEVELAYQINEGTTIAITGTNGKTTVTSLIGDMFSHSPETGLLSGNIGVVASKVAQTAGPMDTMITELSSFQLMGIRQYKPHIAVITNIYSAHLDYHGTQDDYVQAKMTIFKNQTAEDYLVFNDAQRHLLQDFPVHSQVSYFSPDHETNGAYIIDDHIYFQGEVICSVGQVVLPGKHNLENILASIAVCKLSGITNEAIIATLTTFEGIKHRTQYVATIDGVKYYNDSKATNTLATTFALDAFKARVHWLCGGLDRGNGFEDLDHHVGNVERMYIFGETTPKLIAFAQQHAIPYEVCEDVKDAAAKTAHFTQPGQVVLLSPACASWDQYPTYEVRGDEFIQQVKKMG